MITIVIFIVLGIAIFCYEEYNNGYSDFIEYLGAIIYGGIIGLIFGLIIALILPCEKIYKTDVYKLESLQDNNSVSGSFFLGSGVIEGKMKYVFYYQENGLYRMNQIDYDNAFIRYSNESPKVKYIHQENSNAKINDYALDWVYKEKYVIVVPKGTIKQNLTLDAK